LPRQKEKKRNDIVTVRMNEKELEALNNTVDDIRMVLEAENLKPEALGLSDINKSSAIRFCLRLMRSKLETDEWQLDEDIKDISRVMLER